MDKTIILYAALILLGAAITVLIYKVKSMVKITKVVIDHRKSMDENLQDYMVPKITQFIMDCRTISRVVGEDPITVIMTSTCCMLQQIVPDLDADEFVHWFLKEVGEDADE